MWVARDKGNKLWLYWYFKPIRDEKHGRWVQEFQSTIKQLYRGKFFMIIDEEFMTSKFKWLTWEDEPLEVSIVPKSIDEKELDELVEKAYDDDLSVANTNWHDWDNAQDEIADAFEKGFKAGYHKAIGG